MVGTLGACSTPVVTKVSVVVLQKTLDEPLNATADQLEKLTFVHALAQWVYMQCLRYNKMTLMEWKFNDCSQVT